MELRNICKSYHGRPVLQNVSFTIEPGVTPCGRPPGQARPRCCGSCWDWSARTAGSCWGTGVRWSAVFQEDRLLDGLDAMGNLRFALGSGWDEAAARRLLAELGLSDAEDRPVREWSGGMKRRLALARALLADAEAIALDEPFAGLDAENRRHGAECIARRAETTPVLLVTHDRADLEALNARIIRIAAGGNPARQHILTHS